MSFIRLEAENYIQFSDRSVGNAGGQGDRNDDVDIGYSDRNLGVGWIEAGEWLSYDLVIPESGSYQLSGRVTSAYDREFGFKASVAGQSLNTIFTGTGSWSAWNIVDADGLFTLEAGRHELRLDMLSSSFNLDHIDLQRVAVPVPSAPVQSIDRATDSLTVVDDASAANASAANAEVSGAAASTVALLKIEAENYVDFFDRSSGNTGQAYRDNDVDVAGSNGDFRVGWIESGEWLTYDVTVAEAGRYRFVGSVASARNYDFALSASIDGQSTNVTFGKTGGWLNWQDAQGDALLDLTAGSHSLRLDMNSRSFNLDYFTLERVAEAGGSPAEGEDNDAGNSGGDTTGDGAGSESNSDSDSNSDADSSSDAENTGEPGSSASNGADSGGSDDATGGGSQASPVVIEVEAEDYEGFYDRTAGNKGGAYRTDDVDIRARAGQYNIGWIAPKEWLTYEIEVPEAGIYRLDATTASIRDRVFQINVSLEDQLVSLNFGGTGGWFNWQNVSAAEGLQLAAGRHELRLDMVTGGFNLDRFSLTKIAAIEDNDEAGGEASSDGSSDSSDEAEVVPLSRQRIEAEDHQAGLDRSPGNYGNGTSPNPDVDVSGGGVGWIEQDEWLSFEVTVARSGLYQLAAGVASDVDFTHALQAVVGGESTVVEFGTTGGWGAFTEVEGDRFIALEAGQQTLRVNMLSGAFNLDYLDLIEIEVQPGLQEEAAADVSLSLGRIVSGLEGNSGPRPSDVDTLNYGAAFAAVQVDLSQNRQVTRGATSLSAPLKVLTLGDSITEGVMASDLGGYRDDLWTLLNQGGYHVDFVGNRSKGIGSFDRDHAGIGGERIDEIALRTPALLNTYQPDAVLLMGGTNDVTQGDGVATAYARMTDLVGDIFTQAPETQLFLAAIPLTVSPARNQEVEQFNGLVQTLVAEHQADGKAIAFVDVPSKLGISELEDSVHPSEAGNGKLASAWFETWQQTYGAAPEAVSSSLLAPGATHLLGSGFDDVLVGDSQDNIMLGDQGHDWLTGGGGGDRFILAPNSGTDTITDFTLGQDLLVLDAGLSYGEVDVVSSGAFGYSDTSNAVVLDGQGQQLAVLLGVDASQVGASSFGVLV